MPTRLSLTCPLFLALFASIPLATLAQDAPGVPANEVRTTYGLGDQSIALELGLFIPLFYTGGADSPNDANLSLGGVGHLVWSAFVSNNVTVGGEIGGSFSFSPNRNILYLVPIAARAEYIVRLFPFEFPISLSAGMNISRFEDRSKLDAIVMPGLGAYWNFDAEWAFGLRARYWWIPQIYNGPEPPSGDTRFGNFMEVTAGVIYRF